jgi:RNA polymerase subunit RPABC4/transcription elongation factor Spt4
MSLIDCYDCGNPVSLSARQCPQCGSKDLAGPYRSSEKAARRNGVEARNDRFLILMIAVFGTVGAVYGIEAGSSWMRETVGALLYGFVGVVIAVPIAFAVNITRNWR